VADRGGERFRRLAAGIYESLWRVRRLRPGWCAGDAGFGVGYSAGLRSAASSLRAVAAEPRRVLALFGESAGVTAGYGLALVAAGQAFGGGLPATNISAVYLRGSALAAVSPTPGGLGPWRRLWSPASLVSVLRQVRPWRPCWSTGS